MTVVKVACWSQENSLLTVKWIHFDMVITTEVVHFDLIIEVKEVYAASDLSILLLYMDSISQPR